MDFVPMSKLSGYAMQRMHKNVSQARRIWYSIQFFNCETPLLQNT